MGELVAVHPSVNLDLRHDDNIYLASNNQTADQILVLTPALRLEAKHAANKYSLNLGAIVGQYQNNAADNYTNYNLNGLADLDLGTRLRARLGADFIDAGDPRGSTNSAISSTPDRYRQVQGRGMFSYGAREARGRLDIELGEMRRSYYNNRATTAASDRTVDDVGATFNWRIGPKATLQFQGKHSIVDYAQPTSTLNSVENLFQAGGTWEATAKTSGSFRIGVTKKEFDDAARGSSTAMSWTGQLRWSPRTYSHVDLNLDRAPAETSGGVGNFVDRTNTGLRWMHAWSSILTTETSASYVTEDYQGAARSDSTQNYGLRASYRMRRWLSFGGDYAHSVRSSNDSNFSYQRNVFMLFLNAAL